MPNTPPPQPPEPSTWDQIHAWTAHHVDFGDVPTWLAFGGAGVAAYYALRALRVEQHRDQERHDEGRRAQAITISAWPDIVNTGSGGRWDSLVKIRVLNRSDQPVARVRIVMTIPDREYLVDEFRILPPGERVLTPDSNLRSRIGGWLTDPETRDLRHGWVDEYRDALVTVEFTDAAGVRWLRDDDGLREIDTPPHLVRKPLPPDPGR